MTPCPAELELTRALSEGASADLAAHLASCATCRTRQRGLERAIDLARQVGAPLPTPEHLEEARTALLAAASLDSSVRARRPRHRLWVAALAAAAIAVLVIVAAGSRSATDVGPVGAHRHATIQARPMTSFSPASSAPDEIVTLHDGTIDVEVAPLHAGERFRVIVGDIEIEVHGTAFAVTARAGRLVEVIVQHGVVEVRSPTERQMLTAGQSWRGPTPTTAAVVPAPVVPDIVPAPVVRRPKAPPAAARPEAPKPARVPEELAYDDAWAAMRSGQFAQAASAFARVLVLSPTGPLAEDAGFWYAVALARSGQPSLATNAFRDHLDAFPTSRRVGEASAALGWILVDAGNAPEAEQRFRAALTDPNPDIRASATAGLAAVARMRSD